MLQRHKITFCQFIVPAFLNPAALGLVFCLSCTSALPLSSVSAATIQYSHRIQDN